MHALAALTVIVLWLFVPYYLYREEAFNIAALVSGHPWLVAYDFIVLVVMSVIILLAVPQLPNLLRKKKQK